MWARLREQLLAVNAGDAAATGHPPDRAFVQRYRGHIDHEEGELLPLAQQVLSTDELERIGGAMRHARD